MADPEHPYTLEQLGVVAPARVTVDDAGGVAALSFSPTVAHCSMATLIGLCLKVRLEQALPPRFKAREVGWVSGEGVCARAPPRLDLDLGPLPTPRQVDVSITPGTHSTEDAVNKQLADKERVAAALENPGLRDMVARCLAGVPGASGGSVAA